MSLQENTFTNNNAYDSCIVYSIGGISKITSNTLINNTAHFACIAGAYNDEVYTKIIFNNNKLITNHANISFICSDNNLEVINNTFINTTSGFGILYIPPVNMQTNETGLIKDNHITNTIVDDAFVEVWRGLINITNNIYEHNNGSFIRNNGNTLLESNIITDNTDEHNIIRNDISYLYWTGGDVEELIGVMTLKNNIITDNNVTVYGTIMNAANMTMENNTINNNYAQNNGGAINNMGNITISDSTFENNTSENGGGAIYNMENCTIINNTFEENNATYGGCTYNMGNMSLTNNSFINNEAESGKVIENMVEPLQNLKIT